MWDGVCLVGTQLIDAHGSHWHAAGARPILVSKQLVSVSDFVVVFLLFGTAEERCEERLCTWHADMTNGWIFWKLPKSLLQSLCFCLLFSFCYVFFCRYCCCCFRLVWKCRRVIRRKSLTCRRRWRCHRQNATRALCVCGPRWKAPNPIRPFSLTLICC